MRRREFIMLLGGAATTWPLAARAQRSSIPRVGYLFPFTHADSQGQWQACQQGLRELGYSEDKNIILKPRWAEGHYERLPGLVDELLRLNVDADICYGVHTCKPGGEGSHKCNTIVFVAVADPVVVGLVAPSPGPAAT